MKRIVQNLLYQSTYQILLIILPIITIPVISRALGPEGIGVFNYTNSITNYFLLIAGFGLANYGVREIATVRDEKKALSNKFWELETFNAIIAVITIVVFLIVALFLKNTQLYFIQSLILVGALFDITWFYNGIEDFKSITLANLVIKIISFIAIVLFVKSPDDLIVYIWIQSLSILVSQLILWVFLPKKVEFVKVPLKKAVKHFKPALKYLISKMAITLYTNLNKTLLGIMVGVTAVGYYSNSYALVFVISSLLGSLDMVLLPRMSNMHMKGKKDEMIRVLKTTIHLELYLSIAAMFGIITINEKMIPWFFGNEFNYIMYLVPVFAPIVVIKPLGVAILRQYLMPLNKIKEYNNSVILAAIVSIVIAIILMPFVGIFGATIATLMAEVIVTTFRVIDLIKNTTFRFNVVNILKYFVSGLVMFVVVYFATKSWEANIITSVLQVIGGMVIYFMLTTIVKANPVLTLLKKLK